LFQEEENAMTPETQSAEKKPYAEPQLRVYGDVREMTQTGGSAHPHTDSLDPKQKTA
jgi:hypothetical protein